MSAKSEKLPIVVILGPTSSGKSTLAVEVARRFNGEVISADSRQVYKELNLGTGKITKKEMRGVPHHILDVAHPKRIYTVERYRKEARKALEDIVARGNLPIICGGTAFYVYALTDGIIIPEVPADKKLRASLEKKSVDELEALLAKKDPERLETVDRQNKRRLIRAIEIAETIGKVPKQTLSPDPDFRFLFFGLDPFTQLHFSKDKESTASESNDDVLRSRIERRLEERLRRGLVKEAKYLREEIGLSWEHLENLGIEYRHLSKFLQNRINRQEMREGIIRDSLRYAKRQMKWFRRDKRIKWFEPDDQETIIDELEKII